MRISTVRSTWLSLALTLLAASASALILPGTDDRLDPACYVGSPGGESDMAADGSGQYIQTGNVVKCSAWMVGHDYVATLDACVPASGIVKGQVVGLFSIGRRAQVCNGTTYDGVELYPVRLVARVPGRLAVLHADPALLIGTILSQQHTPAPLWFGADHTLAKESTMVSVQDRPRPGDPGADTLTISPICWHNGRGFGSPFRASHNCDSAPNPGAIEKGAGGLIFANDVLTCPVGQTCSPVPGGYAYGYNIGPTGGVSPGGPGSQNTMHFLNDDGDFLAPYVDLAAPARALAPPPLERGPGARAVGGSDHEHCERGFAPRTSHFE